MSVPGGPTVEPTRATHVAFAAVAGFVVAGTLLWTWQGFGRSLPLVGALAWGSVALIALGLAWLTRRTRTQLRSRRDTLTPRDALNRVLLAKTSILAGTGLGAAYLALVVLVLPALPAPLAVERLIHGTLAVVACAVWALAGAALERACRIPEDPDDTRDTPADDGSSGPPRLS